MNLLLMLALGALGTVTAMALWHHGLWGIFEPLLTTWAGAQVGLDLAIALGLVLTWLWQDARRTGRNPWPWLAFTLACGSFGPLLYLLTRRAAPHASGSARP